MSDLLTVKDLWIEGRSDEIWNPIINGCSLTLKKGEVLGLIGESGAGKSTIGLACMGYTRDGVRISEGSVVFDGVDLVTASARVKRDFLGKRIAYVAQSAAASFNPAHKIIDQHTEAPVQHGVSGRGESVEDGIELYRKLRLPNPEEIGFRFPHQVSGGQLQRAMTAMAMSCRPDLIIFDEPTTALDVTTQIEVLASIRQIVEEYDTAAIYITHDLAVVAQMADRIKVLLKGDEVEEADTRTMLSDPQKEYTKSLWAVRAFQRPVKPLATEGSVPVVSVRNITAAYGTTDVLHGVSFDIHAGRTVAVVGESGSGKSTVARCITGLLLPREGEVVFDGKILPANYKKRTKAQLREAQMIYQMADTALNPRKTIGQIIGRPVQFYMGLKGAEKRERVNELLEQIELEPSQYFNRLPSELSGGQKQRISIARAIIDEPKILIFDDCLSAVDTETEEKILSNLKQIMKHSTSIIISHRISSIKHANRILVMDEGQIAEQGTHRELLHLKGQYFETYQKQLLEDEKK